MREKLEAARLRLLGREPAQRRRVLGRLALAGAPLEQDCDQREMGFDLARLVMADAVDHFERGDGIGGDAGLFLELARSAGMDGLSELLHAAGKAPLPDAG